MTLIALLINNAIKFTTAGKVSITVTVTHETDTMQTLEFCISDTGIGISNSSIENIFTAFIQADDSTARRFGGTGLGLKIAKNLIEQMGGQIWVNSTVQVGSQFFFTLTLTVSLDPVINKNIIKHTRTQFTGNVLVAEDNDINQVVAQQIYSHMGYRLTSPVTDNNVLMRLNRHLMIWYLWIYTCRMLMVLKLVQSSGKKILTFQLWL